MNKPKGLGLLLRAAVPGLTANPERLKLFIDKGRVAARAGPTLGFEYRYTLNVVVEGYAGHADALVVPILAWIAEQQPDLLERPDSEPFVYEAEILDGEAADISIEIQLSEAVRVTPAPGGGYVVDHLDEPRVADLDVYPGACGAILWQVKLGTDVMAQTADPAFVP